MKSRPLAGTIALLLVAVITWSLTSAVGAQVMGREDFQSWRVQHTSRYYLLWLGETAVVGLPVLWAVGRKMSRQAAERERGLMVSRGVGRLAAEALRGKEGARAKLIGLLDDNETAVRCQAARALALLSDASVDRELERKVRYWTGEQKLALIDVLRRTRDFRAVKLLEFLARDRNHMIARRAATAVPLVAARVTRMDDLGALRRREQQKRERRPPAARPAATKTGAKPVSVEPADGRQAVPAEPPASENAAPSASEE